MNYKTKGNKKLSFRQTSLPTSGKRNLSKNGNRKPMTTLQANALYGKTLNMLTFQRTAQRYYKTSASKHANMCSLKNEVNKRYISIEFAFLHNNYMRLTKTIPHISTSVYHLEYFIQRPKTNKDLFLYLIKADLI
ncbi:hypothetical protein A9Q86_02255 [Flavobacteriales bacterium 33_180_T64]|nr:hypothetical protein A9Q86_02255 [Flavobacteriales bacterium 33_180_T64]